MTQVKSVAVYCSSSDQVPEMYKEASHALGLLLAKHSIELVYGGSKQGLMGILSKAALDAGGCVYGVIPRFLDSLEGGYESITELHYVDNMHQRKQMMFERADAFVIMPGGLGTLEEVFEVMTWRQIGLHNKFIIFMDIEGYWSDLFKKFFNKMVDQKFVREEDKNLFTLVERVEDLVPFFSTTKTNQHDFVSKFG